MSEGLAYAWMGPLMTSLKDFSNKDDNWASHPLARRIWQVVNEESSNCQ